MAHIWELGDAFLWYYYLSENCSYHVLSVLQAAKPYSSLLERQRQIVIPSDTIRVLVSEPNLISGFSFRPSLRTVLNTRLETLSSVERRSVVEEISSLKNRKLPSKNFLIRLQEFPQESQARILDVLLDAIDVFYSKTLLNRESQEYKIKYEYQLLRSENSVTSPDLPIPTPIEKKPDLGHSSRRVNISYGRNSILSESYRVNYRFALHDPLDPNQGYPTGSTIEMFNFAARLQKENTQSSFWVEDVSLFRVESLTPLSDLEKPFSWKAQFHWNRNYDPRCQSLGCTGLELILGGGYTLSPHPTLLFSLLPEAQGDYSNSFKENKLTGKWGARSTLLFQNASGGIRLSLFPHFYFPWPKTPFQLSSELEFRTQISSRFSMGARLSAITPFLNRSLIFENNRKRLSDFEISLYYYH